MIRRHAPALAAVAVLVALPATAAANKIHFGSNLKPPANRTETHPVDSAFWLTDLPGSRRVKVPAKGRIRTIKLKGTAIKRGGVKPQTLIHFQVLHPVGGGRVRVSLTSGSFHVPVGGDPNQISTYHPIGLCARKGDYIAFNDVGGYKPGAYPKGTPFRVFSTVTGATTDFFSKADGTNNGDTFAGKPHVGEELLMRMTLGTGSDAGKCG